MAERQESGKEGISDKRETHLAVLSLFGSALIWGLIWYPYRLLRDAGIHGIVSSSVTCAIAFALGLLFFRRSFSRFTPSWALLLLALSSGVCNLGYVLATLTGDVLRVLLLFYLAPLWTVLFAWILLGERLSRFGAYIIALSLAGALIMLWHPHIGLPVPRDSADWLGLGAGISFALFNVLSRQAADVSIEIKSMSAFFGVVVVGGGLVLLGFAPAQIPSVFSVWAMLVAIGAVLVGASLIAQYGLARVASNRAIVIMLSEVGFAALASWLLANEVPALRDWIGGAMILAASLLSAKSKN
jgi:drug/metabolite transporter (DMT)-like permease